ncbi:MAG: hypothetical protein A3K03_00660 [Bdellovibrionales bacterium RIFOXYD1_FULL_44_7]|nr:MAG: hypothetical protein A3K03_00660 [Bdellovibrionales bacterium RIFOXYD1_FULL_44_7]
MHEKKTLQKPKYLLLLLALAFVVRLIFSYRYHFPLQGDAGHYFSCARNLIENGYFGVESVPDRIRPPVYPFFLALAGLLSGGQISEVTYTALNTVADLISIIILFLLAKRFSAIFPVLAIGFVAVSPMWFGHVNTAITEPLSITLFLAFLYYWTTDNRKMREMLLSGVFLGLLSLTRSMFLFFPVILVFHDLAFRLFERQKRTNVITEVKMKGVFLFSAYVLPIFWGFRNLISTGQFSVTQPEVSRFMLWLSIKVPMLDFRVQESNRAFYSLHLVQKLINEKDPTRQNQLRALMDHEFWTYIKEHPLDYMATIPPKLWRLWVEGWLNPYPYGLSPQFDSVFYLILFVGPVLVLGTLGIFRIFLGKQRKQIIYFTSMQVLLVMYVTLITAPLVVDARYSLIPFVCFSLFMGGGIAFIKNRFRDV